MRSGPTPSPDLDAADRLADRFRRRTGRLPEVVASAPGRANLIGEHTDYNGGFVLPFALELRSIAAAARRDDGRVAVSSLQAPRRSVSVRLDELDPASAPAGWAAYPLAVVWSLLPHLDGIGGIELLIDGEVPLGAGLSSSAALECAVAVAVAGLVGSDLPPIALALACRRAENEFVGVPSGAMDQLASMLCTEGHALFVDTSSNGVRQVPLEPATEGFELLLIDTGVHHAHARGSYADRRASCDEAVRLLGVQSLREIGPAELDTTLDRLADPLLARRVRHVVTENERVLETVRLLEAGRLREIGPILTAAHASARDDYEISCPELDCAVEAALQHGAFGARLTGGGFGGSAVALVTAGAAGGMRQGVLAAFEQEGFDTPRIWVAHPSAGARRVR